MPNELTEWAEGVVSSISDRGISEATCRYFNVRKKEDGTLIFPYYIDDTLVAQSLRFPAKDFRWVKESGTNITDLPLFGQWKFKGGGKKIIITEGVLDALTIAEMYECKYPVVSIPGGASSAAASFRANAEWLNTFETVVICFDSDEPGIKAAKAAAAEVQAGKAYIVHLPRKDANEMWQAGEGKQLAGELWNGKPFRPDGVLAAKDVPLQKKTNDKANVILWPWDKMNQRLYARRTGELCMFTAGSGSGKSTLIRELINHDLNEGITVGVLMLEENTTDTLHDLMSLRLNKPIRKIMAARQVNAMLSAGNKPTIDFPVIDDLTEDEYKQARDELIEGNRLYLYDHFGSQDSDVLLSKIRYMVTSLGCQTVYLDHISIVISGQETGDERKEIDILMTKLRSLVEETNCNLVAVCHLRKTSGKPHEEGGRITSQDLRGSGSIYQISNTVLALERDQQSVEDARRDCILVRCLKDRFTGFTGSLTAFKYDGQTGRLGEIPYKEESDGTVRFNNEVMGTEVSI